MHFNFCEDLIQYTSFSFWHFDDADADATNAGADAVGRVVAHTSLKGLKSKKKLLGEIGAKIGQITSRVTTKKWKLGNEWILI